LPKITVPDGGLCQDRGSRWRTGGRQEAGWPLTFSGLDAVPGGGTGLALVRQGWATVTVLDGPTESRALDLSASG